MNQLLRKAIYFPITRIILGIGICFGILIGTRNFITKPFFHALVHEKNIAGTVINYISVAILLMSYYYVFRFYEKRKITELSTKKFIKESSGGFLLGFSILSLVILILYALGDYSIINISGFSYLLAPFSVLVLAALIEEVFFRLVIYRILEDWLGTYRALLIISVVFTIPHLLNENVSVLSVLLILIFGFAHGIMYNYTKRLWLPFAFHLGWNFAQPFYGSNLSGTEGDSVIHAKFEGPLLLTGSDFGIEDSIFSIFLLAIISIIFLYLSIRGDKIVKRKI